MLGDAPYYPWEAIKYRLVLQAMDSHELSSVLHIGDIFWRPCTDQMYRRGLGWFNDLRHPVIYTPGDNEWFDCWEPGSGGFAPQGRLDRIRQIFFVDPSRSLGGRRIPLASQSVGGAFPEFVENVRWAHEGILFAMLHLVGSRNAMEPFPARSAADDAASVRRTQAAVAWLRETFDEARATSASAVVLAFHANPGFEQPVTDDYRQAYEPFITALEEAVELFPRPVLMVHGDDHEYIVDHPLARRTSGQQLQNLMRMQVPGSPRVGWVRVVVSPDAEQPFAFEPHIVPRWKYW